MDTKSHTVTIPIEDYNKLISVTNDRRNKQFLEEGEAAFLIGAMTRAVGELTKDYNPEDLYLVETTMGSTYVREKLARIKEVALDSHDEGKAWIDRAIILNK